MGRRGYNLDGKLTAMQKAALLLLGLALLLAAADKQPPAAQGANDSVAISATLYQGKDAVRELLGSDLGGYFQIVKIELTPKGGKPLTIDRDDFLLRSYNDGQKCQPYAPTQIAGRASLAVVPVGGGEVRTQNDGPVFGGPVGTGPPQRLPGSRQTVGNSSAGPQGVEAKVDEGKGQKEDPILSVLKAKILPQTKTSVPVSGLLYFSLDGKHKPKDMALQYKTPSGLLTLMFSEKRKP